MKVLNVAEKNDAARSISQLMSTGTSRRREGLSKYNKIYEFDFQLLGQRCSMLMTSVSGHLLNYEFPPAYRNWTSCSPLQLFDCPVIKQCSSNYEPIKRTLEREARSCQTLVIWTDCDREGENIGFEIIDVCRAINPNIRVLRARFSEITAASVSAAVQQLQQPDANANAAVDVRQQLDLRIGAAFTRFQTLRLRRVFPIKLADQLVSYGSCQFPTLGFVVERFKAIQNFIPEPFWKIKASHRTAEDCVEFSWARHRLFDQLMCQVLYEKCCHDPEAAVTAVKSKPKSKWRPTPLDTVEMEKLCSRKLRISAKDAMRIAEKLYTQGFISYPRTETNQFPKDLNLRPLVEAQVPDPGWGEFARQLLDRGLTPRQGKKSDQAHPPIHPIKYTASLGGDEKRVYELVVRHFLACLSADAQGQETIVQISIADEEFSASGLSIIARNYLDVYPYDKWSDKVMPVYSIGDVFTGELSMPSGATSPAPLLTEADLITLMEKHGIGTDATHADHIETIKSRQYVGLQDSRFVPGRLGLGLVEGYDSMGFHMSKPNLRAELEADLKRICDGTRRPDDVLQEQVRKYRSVFEEALRQASRLDTALASYIDETPSDAAGSSGLATQMDIPEPVCQCPQCQQPVVLKTVRDTGRPYLSCQGYPACRVSLWFPDTVQAVSVSQRRCDRCDTYMLEFTFRSAIYSPYYPRQHTACVTTGCDPHFTETVGLRPLGAAPASRNPGAAPTGSTRGGASTGRTRGAAPAGRTRGGANSTGGGGRAELRAPPDQPQPMSAPGGNRPRPPAAGSVGNYGNNSPAADGDPDNAIVCTCGIAAKQLTVRKDGPNKGRKFFRCGKEGQSCTFFLWAEDSATAAPTSGGGGASTYTGGFSAPPSADGSGDNSVCSCGLPPRRCTVQKAGPNQGRQFQACSKPREQQCRYFKWCDDQNPDSSSNGASGGWESRPPARGRGRGRGSRGGGARRGRGAASGAPTRRKCGVCQQPGHTRKNCPDAM